MSPDDRLPSEKTNQPPGALEYPEQKQTIVVSSMRRSNRRVILLAVLLLLIVGAAAAYYFIQKPGEPVITIQPSQEEPKRQLAAPKVELKQFAGGLSRPTGIAATRVPNDTRLFVLEREGVIKIITQNGIAQAEPFLDIKQKVLSSEEMGLLGLAFSPQYASDGYFFVNYVDKNQNTVIARYKVSANNNKADPSSEEIVLSLKQPYSNHNGGDLLFGKDGFLYVALGDGGSAGDPQNNAQNPNSLLGKILRLDVSQLPYKIPAGNPFVNQAGKKGEIWAWGLRNPWRISFDRKTNDFYIADVGQGEREEINVEPNGSKGGINYGWRCYEGGREFTPVGCGQKSQYTLPAFEYDHEAGRCSITGGYVYRGQLFPALNGKYFYGDYCTGELFWTEKQGDTWRSAHLLDTTYKFSTFGEDSQGELYLADFASGSIYRLVDAANP